MLPTTGIGNFPAYQKHDPFRLGYSVTTTSFQTHSGYPEHSGRYEQFGRSYFNAMEWFDFGVYGYIAITLGHVFFPSGSPTAQLIATFTAAFLVRPLGGLVFGWLGDRYGRHKILALTMIMMAGARLRSVSFPPMRKSASRHRSCCWPRVWFRVSRPAGNMAVRPR